MHRVAVLVTASLLTVVAATALGACGGDSRPYDQVPTSTPALVPPTDANSVASGSAATTTPTAGGTATDTTDTTDTGAVDTTDTGGTSDTGGDTGGTDTGGDTGGTDTGGDTGGTDTGGDTGGTAPDTGGLSPDQNAGAGSFQQFCRDNPGAC